MSKFGPKLDGLTVQHFEVYSPWSPGSFSDQPLEPSEATMMESRQMQMRRKSRCVPCDPFLICLGLNSTNQGHDVMLCWTRKTYIVYYCRVHPGMKFGNNTTTSQIRDTKAAPLHWICKAGSLSSKHSSSLALGCTTVRLRLTSQTIWSLLPSSTSLSARLRGMVLPWDLSHSMQWPTGPSWILWAAGCDERSRAVQSPENDQRSRGTQLDLPISRPTKQWLDMVTWLDILWA